MTRGGDATGRWTMQRERSLMRWKEQRSKGINKGFKSVGGEKAVTDEGLKVRETGG